MILVANLFWLIQCVFEALVALVGGVIFNRQYLIRHVAFVWRLCTMDCQLGDHRLNVQVHLLDAYLFQNLTQADY